MANSVKDLTDIYKKKSNLTSLSSCKAMLNVSGIHTDKLINS